jgi:Flp pilus assembly protein TadG
MHLLPLARSYRAAGMPMMLNRLRRQMPLSFRMTTRLVRRFARRQDGAAAIEFAMVALPFLSLLFAIMETALVFFAGQTLEAAAAEASRLIMTGQAQQANYTAADFKNQVCARIYGLFDCAGGITVDVKNYSNFGSIDNKPPVSNGSFDASKTGYALAGPGCIQVVTLYYQWPTYVTMLGLSNLNGGSHLMSATAVFKNEPYSASGAC